MHLESRPLGLDVLPIPNPRPLTPNEEVEMTQEPPRPSRTAIARTRIQNLTVEEVEAELAAGDVQLIDLREDNEIAEAGYMPGSVQIRRPDFEDAVAAGTIGNQIDPQKRTIFY